MTRRRASGTKDVCDAAAGSAVTMAGEQARGAAARVGRRRGWSFLLLARLGNFPGLRRHVGLPRANLLVADLAHMIGRLLPDATVRTAGRDLVEIAFDADARAALDAALTVLETAFERPIAVDGETHLIDLLLGAAASDLAYDDEVRLAEEAEAALEEATRQHGSVVREVTGGAPGDDRAGLVCDLAHAVAGDELFLQYQPKVHLRSQQVVGVEALVRWQHPVRGLVLPSDFIPLAEESRAIGAITLWTIRRVIADQELLRARGHDLPIFINIAGVLLSDAGFVRRACRLIRGSTAKLGFEITETSVIRDPDSAIANLTVFADIGITIAIDDYGAGLSSLAYLKKLPARELKIDKLFVTQLTSSHRDPLIVRSTIDLAHALEMEVVAEGVETEASLALLTVMGCDMVQGYLISRPIAIDGLILYLDEHRHLATQQEVRVSIGRLATTWKRG